MAAGTVSMTEPVCLIESDDDGKLRVVRSALDILDKIDQPVAVVAIVGLYRTGKSYLMNKLAGVRKGFALGSTIQSKTKGIWMWCVPHPRKPDHTLVLLDTEGLGDVEKGDAKNDSWIFALAILLSSTLVYNSRGTIDNQAVENLQYVTELTDLIKVNSSRGASCSDEDEEGADAQFVQFFPNFVWAVRDFFLELKINGKDATEDEYLENSLKLKKAIDRKSILYNLPRECIRNYFPSRKCFVFPTPTSTVKMCRLESMDYADLSEDFRQITDTFCSYIFDKSCVKTVKGGHALTGSMLGHLAQTYVETIVGGAVPCLENAVLTMAKIENDSAVKEGLDVYRRGMEQMQAAFPVNMDEMSEHHHQSNDEATKVFMSRSFKDENGDFLKKLVTSISESYAELLIKNEEASEKKCKDLLKDLDAPVAQMVQDGAFNQPGGYELYCTHRDQIVTQYRDTPNKGVRAEEILDIFLKEKSVESRIILETDKKLNEADKKMQEEREQAALVEQEIKALREQEQQKEKEIQESKRNFEEMLHQLQMKQDQEVEQQRLEMERAMESKTAEMKRLQEKNFLEKERAMREELNNLKLRLEQIQCEEQMEQSRNKASIKQRILQAFNEGLGHYYAYKQAREQRKALKYEAGGGRSSHPGLQGAHGGVGSFNPERKTSGPTAPFQKRQLPNDDVKRFKPNPGSAV